MPRYDVGNFSPVPLAAITAFYDAAIDTAKLAMDIAHCKGMPCIDIMDDTLPTTYDWIWVKGYYLERMKDYREQLHGGKGEG